MPRRQHEVNFGSDSFLDVIANIVGILVILIVTAVIRVSQGPTAEELAAAAARAAKLADKAPIAPLLVVDPDPVPVPVAVEPDPLPVVLRIDPPPQPDPEPPEELVSEVEAGTAQLQKLKDKIAAAESRTAEATGKLTQIRQKINLLKHVVESEETDIERQEVKVGQIEAEIGQTARQIDVLRDEVAEAENEPSPVKSFRHRMTPVARLVQDEEVHFRLSGNKVSVVPVEVLAMRLQEDLMRHRDAVVKLQRYEGTIGPFGGYRMKYLVEKQRLTLVDELKEGHGVVRFGISSWTIVPGSEIVEETAQQALRAESRFATALQDASRNASLTFWVYPDSFALSRKLQEAAHDNGFEVAVRPLPEGVPITGSRNGSRSFAQ